MKNKTESNLGFHAKIDILKLDELYEGDMEHIRDMFEVFVERIPEELNHLMVHYLNQNWEAFGKQAHKMKPTFEMVGRPDLKEKFLHLEIHKGVPGITADSIESIMRTLPDEVLEAVEITQSAIHTLDKK